jgi:5,10-methylene-tetrahydrofolate dehydrogenase/methenyl tetrahydrofolate cyclohydrolase
MVLTQDNKQETMITTTTNAAPTQGVITQEPIMKTVQEAPVVEKIIEKKDLEIHKRDVVQEIHQQPVCKDYTFTNV